MRARKARARQLALCAAVLVGACGGACPEGAEAIGAPPPTGRERYCAELHGQGQPVRHGPYAAWFADGAKKEEGEYQDGLRVGVHTTWYENGKVAERAPWQAGKLHGVVRGWHESGLLARELSYWNGVRHGGGATWQKNGNLAEQGFYRHGKRDGRAAEHFADGGLEREAYFADGKRHGVASQWWPSGRPSKREAYVDGKKEGPATYWDEGGRRESAGDYVADARHGLWTSWHATGGKHEEGPYRDGKRHGRFTAWSEDGTKAVEHEYRDDEPYPPSPDERYVWHYLKLADVVQGSGADCDAALRAVQAYAREHEGDLTPLRAVAQSPSAALAELLRGHDAALQERLARCPNLTLGDVLADRPQSNLPPPAASSASPAPSPPVTLTAVAEPRALNFRASYLPVAKATASSTLCDAHGCHGPDKLVDGRDMLVWCEGASGPGVGESITLELAAAAPLQGVVIVAGNTRTAKTYFQHARARAVTIGTDAGAFHVRLRDLDPTKVFRAGLKFDYDAFVIDFGAAAPVTTQRLELTFDELHAGAERDALCIAEVQLRRHEQTGEPAAEPAAELVERARALRSSGKAKEAVALLKKVVADEPDNAAVRIALAGAYLDRDAPGLAVAELKRALAIDSANAEALALMGDAYKTSGDLAKARAAYERYLQLEPKGRHAKDVRIILGTME